MKTFSRKELKQMLPRSCESCNGTGFKQMPSRKKHCRNCGGDGIDENLLLENARAILKQLIDLMKK